MTDLSLSDLCDFDATQVDPADNAALPYVGLEHVIPGRFGVSACGRASDVSSSKYLFKRGDVLYGKLRPYLDKAVVAHSDGLCTTELLVLRPKKGVDARFLAAVVHSQQFIEHAMAGVTGAQHPRTSWSHLREFSLPAFDPPAQAKIGAIAATVQEAITACEATLNSTSNVKRAAMREVFTRGLRGEEQKETAIGPAPCSWNVESLEERFLVVSGGTPSRRAADYWVGGTIPWVKTGEINYSTITDTEERITEAGLENSATRMLPKGTVLMAMYGQGVTRARVGVLGIDAACNQACAGLLPRDGKVVPLFAYYFLSYRYEDIRRLAHGGQQQNLNMDIVKALPVSYPGDPAEQREIVDILVAIDQKIEVQKRKKIVLRELFRALLHKLMTGEIRVADLDLSALDALTAAEATS